MAKFKELLTGKDSLKSKRFHYPSASIKKQKLAAAMAWQILNVYPYRSKPFEWLKYSTLRGVMLADEVGGGKTFEALSIISKAYLESVYSAKKKFRVLIISAPAIRSKWEWCPARKSKCKDNGCESCKYSIEYDLNKFVRQTRLHKKRELFKQLIIPKSYDDYSSQVINRKKDWKNASYGMKRQGLWLCSVNSLPPTKGTKTKAVFMKQYGFPSNAFDWIIADEAHVFRSGYMTTDENLPALSESAIRKLYATLNANPNAKLLLLTATPFQNNINELIQLLSLLESDDAGDEYTSTRIAIKGLRSFEEKIKDMEMKSSFTTDDSIQALYQGLHNDISLLLGDLEDGVNLSRPKELRKKKQKDGLDDYLRDLVVRNRKEPLIPEIVLADLSEQEKLQYLLFRDMVYENDKKGKSMISQKLSSLVSSPEAFCRGKNHSYELVEKYFNGNLIYEKKRQRLIEVIGKLKLSSKKVTVVFCRFIPTLDRLEKDLNTNHKVFRLDGSVKVRDRKKKLQDVAKANKSSIKPIVFLVSQVGNEGLDFDSFCNTVIHFDGHYNPAVLDQRNGRVYRGNNQHKDITVMQILLDATYDQRIKFIEQEKRKLKNFYLGDADLEQIFEKILGENQKLKREYLNKLLGFKINLEPNVGHLINGLSKEIN
jgi:SNF2 family DNA or RNA helicase